MNGWTMNASRHAGFAGGFRPVCAGLRCKAAKHGARFRCSIHDVKQRSDHITIGARVSSLQRVEFRNMQRKRWIFRSEVPVALRLQVPLPTSPLKVGGEDHAAAPLEPSPL